MITAKARQSVRKKNNRGQLKEVTLSFAPKRKNHLSLNVLSEEVK